MIANKQIHDGYLRLHILFIPYPNPECFAWIDITDGSHFFDIRRTVGIIGRLEKVPLGPRGQSIEWWAK
jgi:hypothetical protein